MILCIKLKVKNNSQIWNYFISLILHSNSIYNVTNFFHRWRKAIFNEKTIWKLTNFSDNKKKWLGNFFLTKIWNFLKIELDCVLRFCSSTETVVILDTTDRKKPRLKNFLAINWSISKRIKNNCFSTILWLESHKTELFQI